MRVAGEIVARRRAAADRRGPRGRALRDGLAPARAHPVWKGELRDGRIDPAVAAEVGRRIALDPRRDRRARRRRRPLRDRRDLPPDPARALSARDRRAASRLRDRAAPARGDDRPDQARAGARRRQPEEHPVGPRGPVFLDAECAWYGDPAFDLAFCSTTCCSSARGGRSGARATSRPSARSPRPISPASRGSRATCSRRAAAWLLPGLLLARVDGKSPVEYLTEEADRDRVRACAKPLLARPAYPARRGRPRRGGRPWRTRERRGDRERSAAAGSGTRAAGRRSRPRSTLAGGARGRAIAPAGASRGAHEAVDLRDGGARLGGMDVGARGGERERRDRPRARRHGRARPGGGRRGARRARRHARTRRGSAATRRSRCRSRCCTPRRRARGRAAVAPPRRDGSDRGCRCRRSRSSAAARTPAAASTSRTSW